MLVLVSEENLSLARSLHAAVISGRVDAQLVKPRVIRTLPRHIVRRLGVLPVGVQAGRLLVASAHVPEPTLLAELRKFTALPIDFQLVTKSNFDELARLA